MAESPVELGNNREISSESLLAELRHRFMMELKATYWHHFEEGALTGEGYIRLNEAANRALDVITEPISDWDFVSSVFSYNDTRAKMLTWLIQLRCISPLFKVLLFNRIKEAYGVILNYIDCHEQVM